jgi:hypothetical protein
MGVLQNPAYWSALFLFSTKFAFLNKRSSFYMTFYLMPFSNLEAGNDGLIPNSRRIKWRLVKERLVLSVVEISRSSATLAITHYILRCHFERLVYAR